MSDKFISFRDIVNAQLYAMQTKGRLMRSAVPKKSLRKVYLDAFLEEHNPQFRETTVHDCDCCASFLNAVGNAIVVDSDGKLHTLWDVEVDPIYQPSVDALREHILSYGVAGPLFYHSGKVGKDRNISISPTSRGEEFDHMYGSLDPIYVNDEPGEVMSEIAGAHDSFVRSMEWPASALQLALDLLSDGILLRSSEVRPVVEAALAHRLQWDALLEADESNALENITSSNSDVVVMGTFSQNMFAWDLAIKQGKNVAYRGKLAGSLVDRLAAEEWSLEDIVNEFNKNADPSNYRRTSSVVTPKMHKAAQEEINTLGYSHSMHKRHALPSDLSPNDVLYFSQGTEFKPNADVFDDLIADGAAKVIANPDNKQSMTVEQFVTNMLPNVNKVELLLEDRLENRFCNILSPLYPDARSLHPWDNGCSWTYGGDVADSITRRVKSAGGNVDTKNRFSLAWDYTDDLDIHMKSPAGYVYHGSRNCGPIHLDVDRNAPGSTLETDPVENIYFDDDQALPDGFYEVFVNNYQCRNPKGVAGFQMEVVLDGVPAIYSYDGVLRSGATVAFCTMEVKQGEVVKFAVNNKIAKTSGGREVWGLKTQTYVPVNLVMNSPNYWQDNAVGHKHWMFILEDMANPESCRSFYNEQLNGDLHKVRKSMEIVGGRLRVEPAGKQMAGVGVSESQRETLKFRVTMKTGQPVELDVTF